MRRLLARLLLVASLGTLALSCAASLQAPPLPPPDLAAPPDRTTAARLQALARDPAQCAAVLRAGRVPHTPVPPVSAGACGHTGAVRLVPQGAGAIAFRGTTPPMSCPLAAATHLWLREVVAPAAQRHFGARVTALDHFGTYACRNTYGRADTQLSEHARANALDVAGFRLSNGRTVSVLRDWAGDPAARAFLREVRDGACRLYGTTLSPDYNSAHADHLHLDMAARGWSGYCR